MKMIRSRRIQRAVVNKKMGIVQIKKMKASAEWKSVCTQRYSFICLT